jgi:hypothetical protein
LRAEGGKVETNLEQSLAAGDNDGNKFPKAGNGATAAARPESKAGANPANLVLSTNGT